MYCNSEMAMAIFFFFSENNFFVILFWIYFLQLILLQTAIFLCYPEDTENSVTHEKTFCC